MTDLVAARDDEAAQKGRLLFVYLAATGARVEIPAAVSVTTRGEETQFLDSNGVIVAIFRTIDVLIYAMRPIDPEPPLPPFNSK